MTDIKQKGPGDRVPQTTFRVRRDGDWTTWQSADIFAGRTVVVFALPGAFTPTCSKSHLPGFKRDAAAIRAAGVDEIYCLSVNDSFVMNAWAKDQEVGDDEVTMLPDGNADFTRAMGMLIDKSVLGVGPRSWRYAMVVRDGVIERMFVEDRDAPGDPFQVSGAPAVLAYLNSRADAAD